MSAWHPPPGIAGDTEVIRVGLPLLQEDPRSCPRGLALRARPLVTQEPDRCRRKPIQDFALAPVMRILDAIEHGGSSVEEALADPQAARDCHPAHVEWSVGAVQNYLAARAREEDTRRTAGNPETLPVQAEWVAISELPASDARGARRYERTAWGRRYSSADGSQREIWLLSVNSVKDDRTEAEIAAAASVVATGVPARSRFGRPYGAAPGSTVPPQQVRVVGVGCGDGEARVLAYWDAREVARRFDALAKPLLARVVEDEALNPGSDCVRCEALPGCPQPPRISGLLGAPRPSRPRKRRSVSVSDLRAHSECPARFHLTRVLHLKELGPESAAIQRGRAVDAWLNERHREDPSRSCRHVRLPDELPGLTADESAPALRMLAEHRSLCPLEGLPASEQVRVQPRLTAYDPAVDTVVIADPDLLYTDAGGWVWRETKTAGARHWEGRSLLETFPQLALAVLLMASGIPDGDRRRSRVELEVLYEDGSAYEVLDPFDGPTADEARSAVSRLATPWALDENYVAAPGRHCAYCEARRWCPAGRAETSRR